VSLRERSRRVADELCFLFFLFSLARAPRTVGASAPAPLRLLPALPSGACELKPVTVSPARSPWWKEE